MEKSHLKRVILCADDYGQKLSVSQAVVQLVQAKRLSAVSCMVTGEDWPAHWRELLPFRHQVDVGLHFNLTEGEPLSGALKANGGFWPLSRLLLMAMAGRLDPQAIAAELTAQLERFEAVTGKWPDFIDGHQHVQHFPGVREALLAVYAARLQGSGCYVRCVDDPTFWHWSSPLARFKRLVLRSSGAAVFRKRLEAQAIPHNPSFSGVYPFSSASRYKDFFPRFLARITEGGLILCHPGLGEADPADPIAAARGEEFRYLLGPAFKEACQAAGVQLARFRE